MMKGLFNLVILVILVVNGCSHRNNSNGDKILNKKLTIKPTFLINTKSITHIKNIKTGEIEKFSISVDTLNKLNINNILFYNIKVSSYNDSIYLGLKDNIIYSYVQPFNHYEETFYLNKFKSNYGSFLFGYPYIVKNVELIENKKEYFFEYILDTVHQDNVTDKIVVQRQVPNKIFRKIVFSKSRGIISAELYDREKKEIYVTTD